MQPHDEPEGIYEKLRAHYIEEGRREGYERARREAYERGLREGYERGLREGYERGLREGQRLARREVLLRLYVLRFGEVPPDIAAVVHAETDAATLLAWFDLVGTKSVEEIAAALAAHRRP